MSSDDIAISVKNINKSFKLPHEKQASIKGLFLSMFNGKKTYEEQQVLKDINLDIKKGEFFGIVGRNGSGKSTLLKLLAEIYTPNSGRIQVNGKLTPFIELGVGFNPELTGRENVFLNGALLGFSRTEMEAMYDEIVEFAELEKFMDQKLKNYSSGMQVRLAFSIAVRAKSDILLLDEVLAVGDAAFQRKCYEHFTMLKKQKRTVVLVTHDMGVAERFCERMLVIDGGNTIGIMSPRKAARTYDQLNSAQNSQLPSQVGNRWGTKEVEINDISIKNMRKSRGLYAVRHGQDLTITFMLSSNPDINKVVIGMAIYNQFGVNVAGPNSIGFDLHPGSTVEFTIPKLTLNPGKYEATVILFDKDIVTEFDHIEKGLVFEVISDKHGQQGVIDLFGEWR